MGKGLRIAAVVVAADAAAGIVRTAVRPAAAAGHAGLRAVTDMLRPPRPTGWLDGISDPGERYRLAADRHGVANTALLLRALWRRWAFFLLLSAVLFAWGGLVGPQYAATWGDLARAEPFIFIPAFLLLAGQAAFYHWQVRARRLARPGEWLRDPSAWVPPSDPADSRALASWAIVTAAGLLVLPTVAMAATGDSTATDQALAIIQGLLPYENGGFKTTAFGAPLHVLSATLSAVACGVLSWHTVAGVVATAHEGKVLGQRWHQIWAPIRVVIGAGLIFPAPSGYSGGHLLLYQAAVEVNQVTNDMWGAYVKATLSGTAAAANSPGVPPSVGGATVAEQILRSALCAAVVSNNAATAGVQSSAPSPAADGTFAASGSDGSGTQIWSWGKTCGGLSLPVPPSAASAPMRAFSAARIAAVRDTVQAVQNSGLAQQIANWATVAQGNQAFPSAALLTLMQAGQAYDMAMTQGAATLAADQNAAARKKLTDTASAGGWTQAFSYDRALAQASAQTAALASESPTWTAPRDSAPLLGFGSDVSDATVSAYNAALQKLTTLLDSERGAGTLAAADLQSAGDSAMDMNSIDKLLVPFDRKISTAVLDWAASTSTPDPTQELVNLGAKFSAASNYLIGGSYIASKIMSENTYNNAMQFVRPLVYGCIAIGWLLQFWLPLTPFLLGFTLAVGWALATMELVLLVPVWALQWVRMDGQDLIEQQRTGLIIAANWALRPPLAILAYCGVRSLIPLVYPLLKQFPAAYLGSSGGHYVGLVGTIGGVVVLSVMSYNLLLRLYGGIISIPDRVPRLLGLPGDGLDADAHRSGSGMALGVAGGVNNAAPSGLGGGSSSKSGSRGGAAGVRPVGDKGAKAEADAAQATATTQAADARTAAKMAGGEGGSHGSSSGGRGEAGPNSWVNQGGGYDALSPDQQADAEAAYDKIADGDGSRAEWAREIGLDGYVSHVQGKQAENRGE